MRATQVRFCTVCSHRQFIEVRYPKYGADETPLTVRAAQLRCTVCKRKRGAIQEGGRVYRYDGQIIDVAKAGAAEDSATR